MKKHTSSKISNQGLGRLTGPVTVVDVMGCTDNNSINYNPDAIVDDGSCVALLHCAKLSDCPFSSRMWLSVS